MRAKVAMAVGAREAADYARGLVGDVSTPMLPGERVRAARRLRVLALTVLDRAVLVERAQGCSWAEIARALSLSEEETVARYAETFEQWVAERAPEGIDASVLGDFGIGLRFDEDPEGTAASVDAWYARHAEPWEHAEAQGGPCTRALSG